jgi:hypothetical protein
MFVMTDSALSLISIACYVDVPAPQTDLAL